MISIGHTRIIKIVKLCGETTPSLFEELCLVSTNSRIRNLWSLWSSEFNLERRWSEFNLEGLKHVPDLHMFPLIFYFVSEVLAAPGFHSLGSFAVNFLAECVYLLFNHLLEFCHHMLLHILFDECDRNIIQICLQVLLNQIFDLNVQLTLKFFNFNIYSLFNFIIQFFESLFCNLQSAGFIWIKQGFFDLNHSQFEVTGSSIQLIFNILEFFFADLLIFELQEFEISIVSVLIEVVSQNTQIVLQGLDHRLQKFA